MIWLLLVAALAQPCEHPAIQTLPAESQASACALLEQPPPTAIDRAGLSPIFERPGFERARMRNTGALQALLAQLKHWFEGFAQTSGAQTYSNVTRVLVLALALTIGALVVLRFLRRRAPVAVPSTSTGGAAPLELAAPTEHLAKAEALLTTAPREAIREGLFALLSSLERQRYARPDRVKTNTEITAELATRGAPPQLVEQVSPLFGWFDRAFYSLESVTEADARRFVRDVKALLA